jgi:hypothetical protein
MRLFKILLGTLMGVWAMLALVLGLNDNWAHMGLSTRGLTEIAAMIAAVGMLTLFSVWSFQSAFRKPPSGGEKNVNATEDNNGQP